MSSTNCQTASINGGRVFWINRALVAALVSGRGGAATAVASLAIARRGRPGLRRS